MLARWLLLTSSLCKTPLRETGCLGNPYFLFYWLPKHPVFCHPNTVSQGTYDYLPILYSACVTYGTLCRAIGHQFLPTQPFPRRVEDFLRGERYLKHVPPLTYLINLSPKEVYIVGLLMVSDWSALLRIRPSWDLNSLHDKLSMLRVLCFICLATELHIQR